MKKILLLALFIAAVCVGSTFAQDFVIENFAADYRINEDGSFDVTEKIDVNFERKKHGIYREIPYKYEDELGNTKRMPLSNITVTDEDGNHVTNKVSKKGSVVNIRIGDADIYVFGQKTYVISYRVKNGLLFMDDYDEFYWNVTGNYWKAEIHNVAATVSLRSSTKTNHKQYYCFTGGYGSSTGDCNYEPLENGGRFYTTEKLDTYEGLTIAFDFDKGIVAEPSDFEKMVMRWNLGENWAVILPIISFLFVFSQWRKKGRDPKVRDSIMVQYNPPRRDGKDLTPAEVGALIDETLDPRDISASMIGLAVKGYLKIEETEQKILIFTHKDYKITQLKDADSELTEFETILLSGLFASGGSTIMISQLKNKFYKYLSQLSEAVFDQLVGYRYFARSPKVTRAKYAGYGVIVIIIAVFAQLFLSTADTIVKPIIFAVFTGLPFFLFSKAMPAKTNKGALALADIKGFQEFLMRAEKDKLERMNDKELFSKYLPYAIALDVVDHWAKAFEGIEQNTPTWYVGAHGFAHFHPVLFASAITATTSHLSQATFSAPRSSGAGGGGGFSGGGGGGGGGGSW